MNILPKKRWHVRTKDNIARVRKDEAEAAEKEKIRQGQIKLAESEARSEILRNKSRQRTGISFEDNFVPLEANSSQTEHINFFKDVEDGTAEYKKTNKEYEKEKKEEKEKYEKQIGYLTYLGQDTNEALGKRSWYEEVPERSSKSVDKSGEIRLKEKIREDPMQIISKSTKELEKIDKIKKDKIMTDKIMTDKLMKDKIMTDKLMTDRVMTVKIKEKEFKIKRTKSKKKKNEKKSSKKEKMDLPSNSRKRKRELSISDDSEDDIIRDEKRRKLELLREERLAREKEERRKSDVLLAKYSGNDEIEKKDEIVNKGVKQKYNSQFNPYLAKQNYQKL